MYNCGEITSRLPGVLNGAYFQALLDSASTYPGRLFCVPLPQSSIRELKKPCYFATTATWMTEWVWKKHGVAPVKIPKVKQSKMSRWNVYEVFEHLLCSHRVMVSMYDRVRPFFFVLNLSDKLFLKYRTSNIHHISESKMFLLHYEK